MKNLFTLILVIFGSVNLFAQSNLQKIYDTEKAFEKAVAEKGINAAFIEYTARDGVCFFTGEPENCRNIMMMIPKSPAFITWNPTFIDVSSNGALAYSIGNSVYRANGKDDKNAIYGEYVTVWMRQPKGDYRIVFDMGISHDQANTETKWISPTDSGKELNAQRSSAADFATTFFETATVRGLGKAYKSYLAEDARILREGKMPIVGKDAILDEVKNFKGNITFNKRTIFTEAADMAYISNSYQLLNKSNKPIGNGNFLQVWKLRAGKWQIVFDMFLPSPKK